MNAQQVINAVRIRLGDINKERWDDSQLLLYTSLAQNYICTISDFYKQDAWLKLSANQYIYDLPSDCLVVQRLEYYNEFFPIETRNAIDRGEADFPCALKDNLEFNKIEIVLGPVYQDRNLLEVLYDKYGVVVDSTDDPIDTSNCPLENPEGVVVELTPEPVIETPPILKEPSTKEECGIENLYGITAEITDDTIPVEEPREGYLHVYYSAVPPLLKFPEQNLVLPDAYFGAFLHYVCGMALQDDNDANNIARGEGEFQKFNSYLQDIFKKSAKDYTSNVKSKLVTPRRI